MEIDLSPELAAFVDEQVSAGTFASAQAVVIAGLQALKADPLSSVKVEIMEGYRQARAGEFTSRSMADIRSNARRKFEAEQGTL